MITNKKTLAKNRTKNDDESDIVSEKDSLFLDTTLRPGRWDDYVGQTNIKNNLQILLTAAKERNHPPEHILFYGPPGLGKTTLAHLISKEINAQMKVTSGPAIEKVGDLASILTNLTPGDILFIDEIHRLNKTIEEVLYPAMESGSLDIIIGKGPSARTIQLELPPFTLIGATTRIAMISSPLRSRFSGGIFKLEFYTNEEIQKILHRSAKILGIDLEKDASVEIAKRSRYTPRTANYFLKRCRDFAQVNKTSLIETINFPTANWSFESATGTHWQTTNLASVSGAKSIYLQYDSANITTEDVFYTESFNLSSITAPVFNFKIAFANRNASTDNLKIFISTDCGQTWIMKYSKSGNSLATTIDTSQNFIPTPAQWRQDGMNINSATGQNNVRFKFQFTSQGGNNIFIDDININGVTGLIDVNASDDFITVCPTFVTTLLTVKTKTKNESTVCLKNVLGKVIRNFKMNSEEKFINVENIMPGIYFVEVFIQNKKMSAKFIKISNE